MTVVYDILYYVMFFITTVPPGIVNYFDAFLDVAAMAAHRTLLCPTRHIDKDDKLIPFSCQK